MIRIELLGISGYHETELLKLNLQKVLLQLNLEATISEISDINYLMSVHIGGIPALVVNGDILVQKRVPSVSELASIFKLFLAKKESSNMKKIITSTDFSKNSMGGFQFALHIGKALETSVELVHVYSGAFSPNQSIPLHTNPSQHDTVKKHVENFKKKGLELLQTEEAPDVHAEAVLGFPEVELVRMSSEEATYMIIMSTSGSHGFSGKLFGTISTHIGRKANCPVMLIPQETLFQGFKNILYASNFEGIDNKNIQRLISFAESFQANVHFVHVRTPRSDANTFTKVQESISDFLSTKSNSSLSFEMAAINSSSITEGLNDYAENKKIDLVVMVSPHRHFIESLFHKSTTQTFAYNSRLPVLILH